MAVLGNILRFIFAWLDGIIVVLITKVYDLIMELSNLILSSDNIIKTLGQRIGLILGIFMLFRMAITLINYLISPDRANDSSKGGGKLITNVLISLVLLASVNYIFNMAYKLQKEIIDSNIIGKIFFGSSINSDDLKENQIGTNINIGYYLYSSFFTPNTDILDLADCGDLWDLNVKFKNSRCDFGLQNIIDNNSRNNILKARDNMDMSEILLDYDLVLSTKDSENVFHYVPILSTAIGVLAVLILIGFCMDLALRAVKMLFLQIIAPIPIVFNMDPGKGKEIFQKWTKECLNTYLSVFLRLIAINFAVFMIALLYGNFSQLLSGNSLVNVMIVIGCLMFAKQSPKLFEEMLGIKMNGNMNLNPIKKFQEESMLGKNIIGLGAAGTAGVAAMGANAFVRGKGTVGDIKETVKAFKTGSGAGFKQLGKTGLNALYGFGSVFSGGVSAASRGIVGSIKGDKFGQVYGKSYSGAMTARINREDRKKYGVSKSDIFKSKFQSSIYIPTDAERMDSEIKTYEEFVSAGESLTSISESEVQKHADKIKLADFGGDVTSGSKRYSTLSQLREAAHDQSIDPIERDDLNSKYEAAKSLAEKKYRELAAQDGAIELHKSGEFGFIDDKDVKANTAHAYAKNMVDIFNKNSSKAGFSGMNSSSIIGDTKDATKTVDGASKTLKNSTGYRHAHAVQEQTRKENKK